MNLLHIVVILQFIFQVYGQNLVCQKEVWLPSDGSHYVSPGCEEYDGSLVPDCNYFLNNLTSYFHVHEYGRILYLAELQRRFFEDFGGGPLILDP